MDKIGFIVKNEGTDNEEITPAIPIVYEKYYKIDIKDGFYFCYENEEDFIKNSEVIKTSNDD